MAQIESDALYQTLIDDVSHLLTVDQEISLRMKGPGSPDEDDPVSVAVHSLCASLLKKFGARVTPEADKKALEKFLACNSACKDLKLRPLSESDSLLLGSFKQRLWRFFDSLPLITFHDLYDLGGFGNGMNRRSKDESLYMKLFSSRLTASNRVLHNAYLQNVRRDRRWKDAEFNRQIFQGPPWIDKAKLSFVPKTVDITRSICTEPVLNTFFQQGIRAVLEKALREKYHIDFSRQPNLNRKLCREGSLTGKFATIDLTSASDTISVRLLKLLPPYWRILLSLTRSPKAILPGGETRQLWMVSTMGNAYTFPLETVIFICVVHAVYDYHGLVFNLNSVDGKHSTDWAVFGDDIIVPSELFDDTVSLLKLLGFYPNVNKSFSKGPFRESCGVEYHKGVDTRGVYLKGLHKPAEIYVAANLLMRWSAKHNISLKKTVRYLLSGLNTILFVPVHADLASGFRVPSSCIRHKRDHNLSFVYKSLRPKSRKRNIRALMQGRRDYAGYTIRNPSGLHLAALSGCIQNDSYVLPMKVGSKYETVTCVTPNWDTPALGDDLLDRSGWLRWSSESLRVLSTL